MSYPPKITEDDLVVLQVIVRGHPTRSKVISKSGRSFKINPLTWEEIEIATGKILSNSIAHLVANDLIDSAEEKPSAWNRLRGKDGEFYFWATSRGAEFFRDLASANQIKGDSRNADSTITLSDIRQVEGFLRKLGYNLLPEAGLAFAFLSLKSDYSEAETASQIALLTFARDVQECGNDIMRLMQLLAHARAMIDILSEMKAKGFISEQTFQNDGNALIHLAMVDEHQQEWINRVLYDPRAPKDRLAESRIDYDNL